MHDHQGSVSAAFAATWYLSATNVAETIEYGAFGESAHSGSLLLANSLVHLHAGREFDSFTKLHYNRARWYDSASGRFISEDPIGFAGGDANLYRYVFNSHGNATDPSGESIVGGLIGGGIGVGVTTLVSLVTTGELPTKGQVAGAFTAGFITGAIVGSFTGDVSGVVLIGIGIGAGATGALAGSLVQQGIDNGRIDANQLAFDTAAGGAGGGLGAGIGMLLRGAAPAIGGAFDDIFRGFGPPPPSLAFAGVNASTVASGVVQQRVTAALSGQLARAGAGAFGVGYMYSVGQGNSGDRRPSVKTKLPRRATDALPEGQTRTTAENRQARNFFERNRDAARRWWEQRSGQKWPNDAVHDSHPRALKDGGDPLFIEPSFNSPNAEHMIPRPPDGLTDAQRWGRLGGRPKNK